MQRLALALVTLFSIGTTALAGGQTPPPPPVPVTPGESTPRAAVRAVAPARVAAPAATAPATAVMTLDEASKALAELKPGKYEVVLVHPHTCCPVKVCFELPCGCYRIKCTKCFGTKLVFDYKKGDDVVLKFKKDGTVKVVED